MSNDINEDSDLSEIKSYENDVRPKNDEERTIESREINMDYT